MSVIGHDIFPCDRCGKPTPIELLDARDDGTGDFTIMQCRRCYGPGWDRGVRAEPPFYPLHFLITRAVVRRFTRLRNNVGLIIGAIFIGVAAIAVIGVAVNAVRYSVGMH
jgi:hypothetical protein